jgi:predicted DNA-binding protein
MASVFAKKLQEIRDDSASEVQAGGTLSIWLNDGLIDRLTTLASEVGTTRSHLARELLSVAISQAEEDLFGDGAQLSLLGASAETVKAIVGKPKRKRAPVVKAALKHPRARKR